MSPREARIWRTQKLSDCSKSTNVPAGQTSAWISSRVTTSPGRQARRTSTLKGWGCRRTVVPLRRSSPLRTSSSKDPNRSARSCPSTASFNGLDARCIIAGLPPAPRGRLTAYDASEAVSVHCRRTFSFRSRHVQHGGRGARAGAACSRGPPRDRRAQRPALGDPRRQRRARATWTPTTCAPAPRARPTSRGCAKGGVGGQFWSVYIPGEIKDSGFARIQLEQIDIARRMIARYPDAPRPGAHGRRRRARHEAAEGSPRCSAWRAATRSRTRSARCARTTTSAPAT